MIAAYGPRVSRWATLVESEVPIVAADFESALDALPEAVARRARGERFGIVISLYPQEVRFAARHAARLFATSPDPDRRREIAFGLARDEIQVDGRPQPELEPLDPGDLDFARLLWQLGDIGIVRSRAEYERLAATLEHRHAETAFVRFKSSTVAAPTQHDAIVVYGVDAMREELATIALAIEELHAPGITLSCENSEREVRDALARAKLIVDATIDHPASAVGLAAAAVPLCVTHSSGAQEALANAVVYRFHDRDDIAQALRIGLGAEPAVIRPQRTWATAARRTPPDTPLVSVVVATYARRAFLRRTLSSIAAQTRPALETIVVSDCGVSIDDIVAEFPGMRAIRRSQNGGRSATYNTGIAQARGTYVATIDDDDVWFPDHLEALATALERSGAAVAYANSATAFMHPQGDDYAIHSYATGTSRAVDRDSADLFSPFVGSLNLMVRRDVHETLKGFDTSVDMADDYELVLRLLERYPCVHVPRITSLYTMPEDGSNMSGQHAGRFTALHERIFALHPRPARPGIEATRKNYIEQMRQTGGMRYRFPERRLAKPIPLGLSDPAILPGTDVEPSFS